MYNPSGRAGRVRPAADLAKDLALRGHQRPTPSFGASTARGRAATSRRPGVDGCAGLNGASAQLLRSNQGELMSYVSSTLRKVIAYAILTSAGCNVPPSSTGDAGSGDGAVPSDAEGEAGEAGGSEPHRDAGPDATVECDARCPRADGGEAGAVFDAGEAAPRTAQRPKGVEAMPLPVASTRETGAPTYRTGASLGPVCQRIPAASACSHALPGQSCALIRRRTCQRARHAAPVRSATRPGCAS